MTATPQGEADPTVPDDGSSTATRTTASTTSPTTTGNRSGLSARPGRSWWHRSLGSEERQRVLAELGIKRTDHWSHRFTIMLGLSVIVAVMGLSADSAAVVIGAMLLAPLMQPVLATAACISMALFRKSLRSALHVVLASVGSIALAYVLAAVFVNGDLPTEVTSRTAPDIRDLVVALGAGTAGAYATVRKDISSSLPGVAVAVALVPPLGVVGIALQADRNTLARGALLLYTTNLAAIVLAALIVFVVTGFVPPRRLATTFRRMAPVAAIVVIVVIAIAVPLFRASQSAVEATRRQLEATELVSQWLDQVEPTEPPIVRFVDRRILVRVRSFEPPPDDRPLTEALRTRFGADRLVSLEWETLDRFETTTTIAPTTTVISDAQRLASDVERIVDDWLQGGEFDGVRRVDALVIGGGVVRVDASGVGDSPPLSDLVDRLDAQLDATLEVQLTWVERRNVTTPIAPTTDELIAERVARAAENWSQGRTVSILSTSYDGSVALIDVAGKELPDATDLVDEVQTLLPPGATVTVLWAQRVDITTTTTTTSVPPTVSTTSVTVSTTAGG